MAINSYLQEAAHHPGQISIKRCDFPSGCGTETSLPNFYVNWE
jgi:hypothetical protein